MGPNLLSWTELDQSFAPFASLVLSYNRGRPFCLGKPKDKLMINQSEMESCTGFSREVLRKWEQRYQFPVPQRDDRGRRVYSELDLKRLQKIRLLLGAGFRPRQLVGRSLCDLSDMCEASVENWQLSTTNADELENELLKILTSPNITDTLLSYCYKKINEIGINSFLNETLPRMNTFVGNSWERKLLSIQVEHIYTETIYHLLNNYSLAIVLPENAPKAILTTPPGEMHGLGLLGLKIVMGNSGVKCISLGLGTPASNVAEAAMDWKASYVCISVCSSMPHKLTQSYLTTLRRMLPSNFEIWAGGSGIINLAVDLLPGVLLLSGLSEAMSSLKSKAIEGVD